MLAYYHFTTPVGIMGIEWKNGKRKIHRVLLPGDDHPTRELSGNGNDPGAEEELPTWLTSIVEEFQKYFSGLKAKFTLDCLDLKTLTEFQSSVHRHVFSIPPGETRTYSEIASAVHSPGAPRAVGNVMAQNPYPIIVPCHRVVARGGGLGGYRGGLDMKKFLLSLEQRLTSQ